MTLKIEPIFGEGKLRIRLSGQLRCEHLSQLKAEIDRRGYSVVLDLNEVELVDLDGVRFLNECKALGVSILRCSRYIREWMLQERNRAKDHPDVE